MIQLPNGLFYEFEDLPEEVREEAMRSFLEGNMKAIRAEMHQRQRDVQDFGLMWMIHCRGDEATFKRKRPKPKNFAYPISWQSIAHSLIHQRKWERDPELCRKVIIGNLCLFTAEGRYVPIFNYDN